MKNEEKIRLVRKLANLFDFKCEIFYHEQSGKSTDEAVKATKLGPENIVKCLLLKSKGKGYIGAIIRGSDKLDFKALEKMSGHKDLSMADKEDVEKELNFEIGGVPAIIFYEKKIRAFVDEGVLNYEYVVGSGGTPFYGMKFNPRQLVDKLNYVCGSIAKKGF